MTTQTIALRHLIGGAWIDGLGEAAHSENPANPEGSPVATYTTATSAQLEEAMSAASAAARDWDRQGLLAGARSYAAPPSSWSSAPRSWRR